MIAFTLSVFLCMHAILAIWMKWDRRPVIVNFDDKTTSIGTIPFPAVTVCSTEKSTSKVVNLNRLMDALITLERDGKEKYMNLTAQELSN